MRRIVLPALLSLALISVGSPPAGSRAVSAATGPASGPISFGPTTVVDDQRAAGEPGVKICGPTSTWSLGNCGGDNPYNTAPWGFSTTSSFIWRSEDQAHTFKLVPGNQETGKPDACPGGGDSDIAVSPGSSQSSDYLNFADLQALTNFSTGVSRDGGQHFTCSPFTDYATAVDRQWYGVYGNPAGASANHAVVYLDYDIAAQSCPAGNLNSNNFIVQTSIDGGSLWNPGVVADCNDGVAG